MADYLSADDAAVIIESAFAPYRCVAEPEDYGNKVSFRIFDHSDGTLHTERLVSHQFNEKTRLSSSIIETRRSLAERGHKFDDWAL
ncbi:MULTISPECIES: hypothetical protein [Pseudomonas]|uniref:hypothetical protein n=1 Tax=Pseudomonas TaxID=286 RepID=UPI0006B49439|nr:MULTISPECIES: hypothetical protein [Pseudomonas]AOX08685.1 hypothetical protein Q5O_09875 [Pseudomonas putida JB]PWY38970.1 hypothetical protein DK184_24600 [Pseudomonas sp. RW405]USX34940.1 hypothetical protein NH673_17225 [Pseudomonas putida]SIR98741.1 hypothetical protein SAMN05216501_3096 [Pseudomonas putida]